MWLPVAIKFSMRPSVENVCPPLVYILRLTGLVDTQVSDRRCIPRLWATQCFRLWPVSPVRLSELSASTGSVQHTQNARHNHLNPTSLLSCVKLLRAAGRAVAIAIYAFQVKQTNTVVLKLFKPQHLLSKVKQKFQTTRNIRRVGPDLGMFCLIYGFTAGNCWFRDDAFGPWRSRYNKVSLYNIHLLLSANEIFNTPNIKS